MPVFNLFSKRQAAARGELPDIYVYDKLSEKLRVQIAQIIQDAFGRDSVYGSTLAKQEYEFVDKALCREYGTFRLAHGDTSQQRIFGFILSQESVERVLDAVELCFRLITLHIDGNHEYQNNVTTDIHPKDAVLELNARFKENGVGYQFESGEIIRIDSSHMHAEAVKPALSLLREKNFKGANEEFLSAHANYRHGRYKECLIDCLKSFESTMKTICSERGWQYDPGVTAKGLVDICVREGLFPKYLESQIGSLRSLLESGVPTLRNKLGGHGQGAEPVRVPEHYARYALNLTATTILFLVESHHA